MVGETVFFLGHILGQMQCSLCDITHGPLRRKRDWDQMLARLGVPFELVHRNEQGPLVAAVTGGQLPAVVAVQGGRAEILMGPEVLAALNGRVEAFEHALAAALRQRPAA